MRILREVARTITGLVFVFSGLSKGIDPLGSMYKFVDYFTAFGLDSLNELAYILGIGLCAAEFIIGFALLTGLRMNIASWGLLIFMAGFTPLTFVLAINNPVSDCGCFGDAIHLSNWQTFLKNIVILALALPVFSGRQKYQILTKPKIEWIILAVFALIFVLFTQYNHRNLPLVDFRPYITGSNISEGMIIPDGAPIDEYDVALIYEKDGKKEEFTIDNYPSDTSWVFVDQKLTLITKGYIPPIHDFSIVNSDGEDITNMVLTDPAYSLLMISKKLSDIDIDDLSRYIQKGREAQSSGINFYILSSSATEDLEMLYPDISFTSGDETNLKTIIRSNPGFMLLKAGTILAKWSDKNMPEVGEIFNSMDLYNNIKPKNILLRMIFIMLLTATISLVVRLLIRKGKN